MAAEHFLLEAQLLLCRATQLSSQDLRSTPPSLPLQAARFTGSYR